eukprot:1161552-Pelagomonas_calceolata.AAC.5
MHTANGSRWVVFCWAACFNRKVLVLKTSRVYMQPSCQILVRTQPGWQGSSLGFLFAGHCDSKEAQKVPFAKRVPQRVSFKTF